MALLIQISLAQSILTKLLAPLMQPVWLQQGREIFFLFVVGFVASRVFNANPSTKYAKWLVFLGGLQMLSLFWSKDVLYRKIATKLEGPNVARLHVAISGLYTLSLALGMLQPKHNLFGSFLNLLIGFVFFFLKLGDRFMDQTMLEPCKAWFGLTALVLLYGWWLLYHDSQITGAKMKRTAGNDVGKDVSRRPILALSVIIPLLAVSYGAMQRYPSCCEGAAVYKDITKPLNYTILARTYSKSGYIEVVEEPAPGRNVRVMRVNHNLIGGYFLDTLESIFANFYFQALPRFTETRDHGAPLNVLICGLGAGTVAGKYVETNENVDIVEYDPVIIDYAKKYFPFLPHNYPVVNADCNQIIKDAPSGHYDVVVVDLFPAEFDLVEMLPEVKRILRHGITGEDDRTYFFVYNWVGYLHRHNANLIAQLLLKEFPVMGGMAETANSFDNVTYIDNMVWLASNNDMSFAVSDEQKAGKLGPLESHLLSQLDDYQFDMVLHRLPGANETVSDWETEDTRRQHYRSMFNMFDEEFWLRY